MSDIDTLGTSNQNAYIQQGSHGDEIDPAIVEAGLAGAGDAETEPVNFTSGYVSDSELLVWLKTKSQEQGAALEEQMNLSTARTHYIEQLTDLKGQIDGNDHADNVLGTINGILNDPQNAPFDAELGVKLRGCIDALKNADPPDLTLAEDALKNTKADLSKVVDGQIDDFNKMDGLALVQIQQLAADQRETSGLVSSLLASNNQTRNGIIANFRG
ncbi:MAG TPA: hypothetical protein VGQ57_11395 [Polyangiaceae bacterium]|jgi:hypothetical protein|nr:hypothetical protein [Polyangiaceae bacterium]